MKEWYRIIKTYKGDFVVMRRETIREPHIMVYFHYLDKTVSCFYPCKNEKEVDELFESFDEQDCFDSLNIHITSLN